MEQVLENSIMVYTNISVDNISMLTPAQASLYFSNIYHKTITTANISYLINYGKIKKIVKDNQIYIDKNELGNYYRTLQEKQNKWKQKLGDDLNWDLSFDNLKEAETTKHVHRLHPYKGKYIPQLVEYFLRHFKPNDYILDPFCGSGTTLVQANENGMNAVGVDVSEFNTMISNVKLSNVDLKELQKQIEILTRKLTDFVVNSKSYNFENRLSEVLNDYNTKYFPKVQFNLDCKSGKIDKNIYTKKKKKENEITKIYYDLVKEYAIDLITPTPTNFLEKWYLLPVLNEIYFIKNEIDKMPNDVLKIILSRTIRSCRATTHYDLGTLKEPVIQPYYCNKHFRICKPLFSILKWWNSYGKDTLKRLTEFRKIKTDTKQICLCGDSRNIDLDVVLQGQKLDGIFSSPPYVGLIDYHEQHAYSYDLFGFNRNDNSEIGPLFKGKGVEAKKSYIKGISDVLINCKRFLKDNANIFLVANDNYNLYPQIAEMSGMKIVEQIKRPVLNRVEGKEAYCEVVFRMRIDNKNKEV